MFSSLFLEINLNIQDRTKQIFHPLSQINKKFNSTIDVEPFTLLQI